MAAIQFRQRRVRRWWYLGMTIATATALAVLFVGGAGASLPGSTFGGGDGNLACNDTGTGAGALDWNCLPSGGLALHTGVEQFTGQQDNSFGQGTKEDDPNVTLIQGSIPPQKSDLTRFYEASEVLPVSGSDHVFLYLAWERSNVLGNANMDFEINKTGTPCLDSTGPFPVKCTINRTNGDILVTYDFGGSGTPTIGLRTWNGSSWQTSTGVVSESAVNSGTVTDTHLPSGSQSLVANTFGEAAIDLTASGLATGCGFSNATTFLKSRSSSAFTSEIKDFVAPIATPIAPCQSVLTTTATASVTVGSPISDTAHLSGVTATAGGTITFSLYSDASCSTLVTTLGPVTVSGPGDYASGDYTPSVTGTYYWIASYSGDANNIASSTSCGDAGETSVVNPIVSTISTHQSVIPNDSATIGGGGSGTVRFRLYAGATCDGTALVDQTANVVNGAAATTNTTVAVDASGTYSWLVVYSGDATHTGATSTCSTEHFVVTFTNG
jgi:hypothetical protein